MDLNDNTKLILISVFHLIWITLYTRILYYRKMYLHNTNHTLHLKHISILLQYILLYWTPRAKRRCKDAAIACTPPGGEVGVSGLSAPRPLNLRRAENILSPLLSHGHTLTAVHRTIYILNWLIISII